MAGAVREAVEALADLPPGPALGAALAAVDPRRVPNNFLPGLLAAQSRQSAHEAARMLGVLAEVGRARPTFDDTAVDRLDHRYRHSADEVRAALAWSRRAADAETEFAEQVVFELPAVHAAFLGRGDRPAQGAGVHPALLRAHLGTGHGRVCPVGARCWSADPGAAGGAAAPADRRYRPEAL
jgi:hypothetical protein